VRSLEWLGLDRRAGFVKGVPKPQDVLGNE
jgi:hypothetical protein